LTGDRGTFRPAPVPAAVPASQRGHIEVAPDPARPGMYRLWLHGDGSQGKPRSILLTQRDVRGLIMFLRPLAEPPDIPRQGRGAAPELPQRGPGAG
jgi:hypothetical protein